MPLRTVLPDIGLSSERGSVCAAVFSVTEDIALAVAIFPVANCGDAEVNTKGDAGCKYSN